MNDDTNREQVTSDMVWNAVDEIEREQSYTSVEKLLLAIKDYLTALRERLSWLFQRLRE